MVNAIFDSCFVDMKADIPNNRETIKITKINLKNAKRLIKVGQICYHKKDAVKKGGVLQKNGAKDGNRTRGNRLGKPTLYH